MEHGFQVSQWSVWGRMYDLLIAIRIGRLIDSIE